MGECSHYDRTVDPFGREVCNFCGESVERTQYSRAKDKAEDLVRRFEPYVYPFGGSGYLTGDIDESVVRLNAKQCALIVTQELSESTGLIFWEDVRKEIEKL